MMDCLVGEYVKDCNLMSWWLLIPGHRFIILTFITDLATTTSPLAPHLNPREYLGQFMRIKYGGENMIIIIIGSLPTLMNLFMENSPTV